MEDQHDCLSKEERRKLAPSDRWSKESVLAVMNHRSNEEVPEEVTCPMLWCQLAPYEICFDQEIFWMRIHCSYEDRSDKEEPALWLRELPEPFVKQLGYGTLAINYMCDYYTDKSASELSHSDFLLSVFTKFSLLRSDPAVWKLLIESAALYQSNDLTQRDFYRYLQRWAPKTILEDKGSMLELLKFNGHGMAYALPIFEILPYRHRIDEDFVTTLLPLVDTCGPYVYNIPWSEQVLMPPAIVAQLLSRSPLALPDATQPGLNPELCMNREFLREYIVRGGRLFARGSEFDVPQQGYFPLFPRECLDMLSVDDELLLLIAEHDRMYDSFIVVASDTIRRNKVFMLRAIEKHGWLLTAALGCLQYDFDLALVAFASTPELILYYMRGGYRPAFDTVENREKFPWRYSLDFMRHLRRNQVRDREFMISFSQRVQERMRLHEEFTMTVLLANTSGHLVDLGEETSNFILKLIGTYCGSFLDEEEARRLKQTAASLESIEVS